MEMVLELVMGMVDMEVDKVADMVLDMVVEFTNMTLVIGGGNVTGDVFLSPRISLEAPPNHHPNPPHYPSSEWMNETVWYQE